MQQSKRPIQYKITRAILITSTIVLLLTQLAYFTYEFFTFRENTVERMSVLGEVISNASTAALAFDSQEDAYEILSALRAQEHIVVAVLFDDDGMLFSKYPDDVGTNDITEKPYVDGYYFEGFYLYGFEPVLLGGNRIGTLYLKYDLTVLSKDFRFFALIAFLVFILSFLLAWFLSSRLQKQISKPIIDLADVARSISAKNDYTVRAVKQSEDETGLLTDAFNQMLAQIEQQNIAIQESEKNFRTLADNIPNLCWMANAKGEVYWYNSRWFEYTGTTPEELEGLGWQSVHDPEVLPEVIEKWKASIETGEPFDMVFPMKGADGKFRPFLTRIMPVRDEKGKILKWFGTNTDISELREVEDALRKSEQFSRTLLESSPDCVKALDFNGNLISINPQGLQMLEIDEFRNYYGLHCCDLWLDEYHDKVMDAVKKAQKGQIAHFQGFSPTIKGTFKWWDVMIAPVYEPGGNVERLVSVARDITKLKELEQQKDDFIGIASHELKTPVTSIKAYTQVLQHKFQNTSDKLSAEMLDKMDRQVNKLTNLITDLLDVTKIEKGKLQFRSEQFYFNDLVEDSVEEIQRTRVKHQIKLKLTENRLVSADRDRIGQVIINMITNAIKYSPKAKEIVLATEIVDNKELIFSVRDFGIGLSKENLDMVFERFYRVEGSGYETYPGLGLGLYISAGIIQRHDGRIWVESEKGKGSTFFFSLPLENKSGGADNQ